MNSVSQLRVWKCLADTQKILNQKDDWKKSFNKVTELENQFSMGKVIDDDEEERNSIEDDDDDDLIEKELLLSDSGEWYYVGFLSIFSFAMTPVLDYNLLMLQQFT